MEKTEEKKTEKHKTNDRGHMCCTIYTYTIHTHNAHIEQQRIIENKENLKRFSIMVNYSLLGIECGR